MLEWLVFVSNWNRKTIETHNVFDHAGVRKDLGKAARKYSADRKKFAEEVRISLMYHYWCKCEWEVVVSDWPPRENGAAKKIDVYSQVMLNWDRFVDYLWNNLNEAKKWK